MSQGDAPVRDETFGGRTTAVQDSEPPQESPLGLLSTFAADPQIRHARQSVRRRLFGDGAAEAIKVDRFTILESLGGGGMGVVYAAYDPQLDRKVALKLLRGEEDADPRKTELSRERMIREAQAMARVSHPNVIGVHQVGVHEGQVFVAMEFVDGGTLRDWLEQEERSWRQIRDVFVDIGKGLAAAHAVDLVHRDFKPDNVMITRDGHVLVLDFGLAKRVGGPGGEESIDSARVRIEESDGRLTLTGALMGTPAYMAPEQHRGEAVDARTDQFGFCVALWEALYEDRPFQAGDYRSLADDVIHGRIVEPSDRADVPARIDRAVRRGLAVRPDDRFESMAALLAELRHDPGEARRRLALGAALVVSAGGVAMGVASLGERSEPACQDLRDRRDEAWSASTRDGIERAFRDTERPYAAEVYGTISGDLDAHLERWTQLLDQACVAESGPGDEPALRAAGQRCLEERLLEVEALVSLFRSADGEVVENAVAAVDALTPLASCEGRRALARAPALPEDQRERALLLEQRARLVQARGIGAAGKHREAIGVTRGVVDAAAAVDYGPLLAEAKLELARQHAGANQLREAEAAAREALLRALGAEHEAIALQAATALIDLVGWERADFEGAVPWMDLAQALVDRPSLAEQAPGVQLAIGRMFMRAGRHTEALASFRSAATELEHAHGADALPVADALVWVAAGLAVGADFDGAQAQLERALQIRVEALGARDTAAADVHQRLGELQWKRGRYAAAQQHHEDALAIVERAQGRDHPAVAAPLMGLARTHWSSGRLAEAAQVAAHAVEVSRSGTVDDAVLVAAYEVQAHAAQSLEQQTTADAALRHASAIALRHGAEHPLNAFTLYARAELQRAAGKPDKALGYLEQSRTLARESVGVLDPRWHELLVATGLAYLEHDEPGRAVDPLERAVAGLSGCCAGHFRLADAQLGLARALRALDRDPTRVADLARAARDRLRSSGREHDAARAESLLDHD